MTVSTDQAPSVDEESRAVAAERLTFFGDAVIAIALTLLALELPLPEGATNSALLHSAFAQREGYLAFMISFLVIAAHWRAHHRLFRHVPATSNRLTGLTLYWLLTLVITPFATKVLNGGGAFQVRFIFYAAVQLIGCVLFVGMVREIRRGNLYRKGTPPEIFAQADHGTRVVAVGFLVSIPVSLFTHFAYACWILVPLVDPIVSRRLRRSGRTS
jgi:uncharacterized membrane protein